jgi:TIR domain
VTGSDSVFESPNMLGYGRLTAKIRSATSEAEQCDRAYQERPMSGPGFPHNIFGQPLTEDLKQHVRVFISHRLADKPVARSLARYFEFLELHYYLDEEDEVLQRVINEGLSGDRALVESIDAGVAHSTHLIAVLSERTMGSWWVPYEVGCARARGCEIVHLLLPSIKPEMVPEYLRIYGQLWSPMDVFEWVKTLVIWPETPVHRFYREWFEEEGYGPFGELGPDEELIEHWIAKAERENSKLLQAIELSFT